MQYYGCRFIALTLWIEEIGACLQSPNLRTKLVAWFGVLSVASVVSSFYLFVASEDRYLSRFVSLLVLESGASCVAFFVLLSRPIRYALRGLEASKDIVSSCPLSRSSQPPSSPPSDIHQQQQQQHPRSVRSPSRHVYGEDATVLSPLLHVHPTPSQELESQTPANTGSNESSVVENATGLSSVSASVSVSESRSDSSASTSAPNACPTKTKVDVTFLSRDPVMVLNGILFLVCVGVTTANDSIHTAHSTKGTAVPITARILFITADFIADVIFAAGFLFLAVAYRILALRVWRLRSEDFLTVSTERTEPSTAEPSLVTPAEDTATTSAPPRPVAESAIASPDALSAPSCKQPSLEDLRSDYEMTFKAAEELSHRTSILALAMISLAVLEIMSIGQNIQVDTVSVVQSPFRPDFVHLQLFRILIVLAILLFQVILSSANLMFASERLAETLSQKECELREQVMLLRMVSVRQDGTTSTDPSFTVSDTSRGVGSRADSNVGVEPGTTVSYQRQTTIENMAWLQAQADLLKTLSCRIRSHPARISWGWFHLTTEWSMGVCVLVSSAVLGFIGIHLPSQE